MVITRALLPLPRVTPRSPVAVQLLARIPEGGCNYRGLLRAPAARRGTGAEEAQERLFSLGRLMLLRGLPDLGELLLGLPLLLSILKDRRQALSRVGFGRGEWVAAAQLFVELHDLSQVEEETEEAAARRELLHAALCAFRLRAATCLHTAFSGDASVLAAVGRLR